MRSTIEKAVAESKPPATKLTPSRRVALSALFVALGVALSVYPGPIPFGPAKLYPFQSMINVLAGVTFGPYAAIVALLISLIRMSLGVGTVFSLPGSIPGALLVGSVYRYVWRSKWIGLLEIVGTGLVGAYLSGALIAPLFAPRFSGDTLFFVLAFTPPAVIGSALGIIILHILERRRLINT